MSDAERFMLNFSMTFTSVMLASGKLTSLRPEKSPDGIIQLGGRAIEGMQHFYESESYPILSPKDPIAYLWMKESHEEDHSGISKTVAKSRRRFWIVRARKLATKIKGTCYDCRLLDKTLAQQQMAPLPTSRQVMSPTFHEVALDLFGPFEVKDTVKKRCRKKVWGIILNCLSTRAVHIDVSEDYGTDAVIQVIRKFIALRGSPATFYSDKGSQLGAASEDLKAWAVSRKIEWIQFPAEGQHQNGTSESLIKSVKRSLSHVIGKSVLTFSGLQLVFYEVADLVNSRPIGVVTGSDPTQPEAITPNHLILGRATSSVPQGQFIGTQNVNLRLGFLQSLVGDWWKRWYESVLPTLVPSYKWLQRHRNAKVGDICLIKYRSEIKGRYRLGRINRIKISDDGLVRTVTLVYKNANENVFREVDRPVQGIAVIVPIEEQAQDTGSTLNPAAKVFEPSSVPCST